MKIALQSSFQVQTSDSNVTTNLIGAGKDQGAALDPITRVIKLH
jgi:hypothetical protein